MGPVSGRREYRHAQSLSSFVATSMNNSIRIMTSDPANKMLVLQRPLEATRFKAKNGRPADDQI